MLEKWLDPQMYIGTGGTILFSLVVLYFYRRDNLDKSEKSRAERMSERELHGQQLEKVRNDHREDMQKVIGTFENTSKAIINKAEVTERLCEKRYEILLKDRLKGLDFDV